MAYPQWLTPAGNLGIVPSAEYYQLPLDAYDTTGGTLVYSKLSGILPPGIQITSLGVLQGIPVSTAGPDLNQTYTFTVRVKNQSSNELSDRTFNLTVTNVAPPVIVPRNVSLGTYFDGDTVSEQLVAVEFILEDNLIWTVKDGVLPSGLTLSPSGLLSGYLNEIPAQGPSSDPGWDDTDWDLRYTYAGSFDTLGWDFPLGTVSKNFTFTIQVTDGARSDLSTYTMLVVPKMSLTADSTILTVDTTRIDGGDLTVDTGPRHIPIIITNTSDIPRERQGGWFAYQIKAIDLDDDVLQYTIPTLSQGSFDEQSNSSVKPYVDAVVSNGNITIGVTNSTSIPPLASGDAIQVLVPTTDLLSQQPTLAWYDATVTNYTTLQLAGSVGVSGVMGNFVTQSISGANASIANIAPTLGTLTVGGGLLIGTISVGGNLITANVGDFITQIGTTANATVVSNASQSSVLTVRFTDGTYTLDSLSANLKINGANVASYPVAKTSTVQYVNFIANVGDYITQPSTGANATVTVAHSGFNANTANPFKYRIKLNSGNFTTGAGNLRLNGVDFDAYPQTISCTTDITAIYQAGSPLFRLNVTDITGQANIAGSPTNSYVSSIVSVGVTVAGSPNTQGTIGFDESRFDQGTLAMPGTLSININSGWITGFLPDQIPNSATYQFVIQVNKRDYANYITTKLLELTVYGDLYNEVDWLTPSYLGTIENGSVSDLYIEAISTKNKTIYYQLNPSVQSNYLTYTRGVPGPYQNIPQGLVLKPSGLISGRVSFQLFSLDSGQTTFDIDPTTNSPATTFDETFEFSVLAETFDQTASAVRVFTIRVRDRNLEPYENLYLKAQLTQYQKLEFRNILQDSSIFPPDMIYRSNDPWFGQSQDIKTLFLPGLNPSLVDTYLDAMQTNHFTKRILFGDVKTAVARQDGVYDVIETSTDITVGTYNVYTQVFVPTDFSLGYSVQVGIPSGCSVGSQHVKYEVIYLDILDENSNSLGQGPADSIDLRGIIQNYYYDSQGNSYYIAAPNAFTNMDDAILNNIGYANKGALPDWMTSIQPNGVQLGFIRAAILAYVKPGTGETIAWRLAQRGYNFNELTFTAYRYLLDNNYTANYDILANAFITSTETTFDRYPKLVNVFTPIASVDYAVDLAFENINERAVSAVNSLGGMDGITTFKDGETLIFYTQEYPLSFNLTDNYDQGWSDSLSPWDGFGGSNWDDDKGTASTGDDLGWDGASYVPGFKEWSNSKIVDSNSPFGNTHSVINQRISVWRINIDSDNYVSLTLANVTAMVTSVTANTAGFGSNISLKSTNGLFVGMPVRATGLAGNCQISDIVGNIVTVYPAATSTVSSTITFIPQPNYNDAIYIRNGFTHGGVNAYFDPIVKENNTVPNYSEIPQEIKTTSTVFDGNGTLFYDYRDEYSVPEQGSAYLRFPRSNVFH